MHDDAIHENLLQYRTPKALIKSVQSCPCLPLIPDISRGPLRLPVVELSPVYDVPHERYDVTCDKVPPTDVLVIYSQCVLCGAASDGANPYLNISMAGRSYLAIIYKHVEKLCFDVSL